MSVQPLNFTAFSFLLNPTVTGIPPDSSFAILLISLM
jgi:hypothetical protein